MIFIVEDEERWASLQVDHLGSNVWLYWRGGQRLPAAEAGNWRLDHVSRSRCIHDCLGVLLQQHDETQVLLCSAATGLVCTSFNYNITPGTISNIFDVQL